MVNYFKTQWLNLVLSVFYLGLSIYQFCIDDELWGIAWALVAVVGLMMSFINYNDDRVKLLEKKQERDDAMFELVQELIEANKLYSELETQLEARIKQLEEKEDV